MSTLLAPATAPQDVVLSVRTIKPRLPDSLFSQRLLTLGSENAFRIGPQIRELELQGTRS
jgi:hypothetical protein